MNSDHGSHQGRDGLLGCFLLLATLLLPMSTAPSVVPSTRARTWGVASYRIERDTRRPGFHEISVQLLAADGAVLGRYTRTRHFRAAPSHGGSPEVVSESVRFEWHADRLEIVTDAVHGTFSVHYDGKDLGEVKLGPHPTVAPGIAKLKRDRGELFNIAGAVSDDLDAAMPDKGGAW